ncbi:MAG: DUF1049 domain-containing protein [Alphaproteobacteria bacterium]|nr:DUF1049 domain-containing protein [Alphaproteobacteria bacterium]
MIFLKMLIGFLFWVVLLVFAFVNNDLATFNLWPFYVEVTVSLSVAIVFLVMVGFVWGVFSSWLSNAPLRASLRKQKRKNKQLHKEHQKLSKEMEGLQSDIANLKEPELPKTKESKWQKFRNIFAQKDKMNQPLS